MDRKLLAGGAAAVLALAAVGYFMLTPSTPPQEAAEAPDSGGGALSDEQIKQLGIATVAATASDTVPLGTVPGQISLPPEAKVAVTTPFDGTATRVFVLQGEQVGRGQPLAIVRSAAPVQFSADLARAQADLAVDRAKAQRLEMLARDGIVAGARADEAKAALRRSEATVAENRRLLSLAGAGHDGTVTLRAPISGRVSTVAIETGGHVGGDMAPFVIENTTALTLDLQLPARLAGQVRPGMEVSVPLPGDGNARASGRIVSVGASLDPMTRSTAAKARLGGVPGLMPGQSVMAVISGVKGARQAGISVPSQAVTRIGDQDVVFVRQGGRFERRPVTVATDAGGQAIIASGVKAGDQVAVSGIAELKSLIAE
ncbi:efflux RND transporter periplasmic adaptor subunit [Novosphingobium malaysiense]|uniref:Uncharacterized protein n=1 Tax=Novosphingobium malaysiense TaxID=1348853 RepID=A0A0B1ZNN6_9SPHN|nr:efflux RND transporter periplasmic adaptor subunit [Novosphingobium malaysiense]KHK90903.1 hypothetical protein LK12_08070 [Novosphingobium malaysiense]